ncbi:MAG TPA: DUF4249 family protein [bacterium]
MPTIKYNAMAIFMMTAIMISCGHQADENFENMLNITGVVRNEADHIELTVNRTYNMDEPANSEMDSAIVMLFNNDYSDTFIGQYAGYGGFFWIDTVPVNAGDTYNLMIAADGYDTVYGQTTVPDDYQIIYPLSGDTMTLLDTLLFTVGKGIEDYQIECWVEEYERGFYYYFPNFENDSIIGFPVFVFSDFVQQFDTTTLFTFMVIGYDSNYYNYHYFYDSDDPPQCGVSGGIGLFGSAWVRSVDVYLKVN